MDFDEVADELYEVPPEEFVALRKVRQDDAQADGDRALAADIGALPKPSVAAWVCNLLVRAHREEIPGLVQLGELLREAQQNLAGEAVAARRDTQRSSADRRPSAGRSASLARERGLRGRAAPSPARSRTPSAPRWADPEAAAALLTGRLTAPMFYRRRSRHSHPAAGTCGSACLPWDRSPRAKRPAEKRANLRGPQRTSADERRAGHGSEETGEEAAARGRGTPSSGAGGGPGRRPSEAPSGSPMRHAEAAGGGASPGRASSTSGARSCRGARPPRSPTSWPRPSARSGRRDGPAEVGLSGRRKAADHEAADAERLPATAPSPTPRSSPRSERLPDPGAGRDRARTPIRGGLRDRTTDPPADHSRSGDDVAEAIEVAERGSSVQEVHDRPQDSTPGTAPVERTAGDPEMTEGQVVLGDDD